MAEVTLLQHENWRKSGAAVVSRLPEDEIEILEDRAIATIADPTTLGLWGFATGTWVTGTVIAGKFPPSALIGTIPVLLVFAGIAQFIAGLISFRRVNMLSATAFCAFGSFNVLTALLFGLQANGKLTTTGDPLILQGFILISFGFIALALTLAALRSNAALVLTLLLLAIGYVLSGIPQMFNTVGTALSVASEISAVGSSSPRPSSPTIREWPLVVNSSWKHTVLPIGGEP